MKNMWEMIELTFIIPNTASDQLFFNGFLDLIELHSHMKSTPQMLPLWFRWLTHCVMQKERQGKKIEVGSGFRCCYLVIWNHWIGTWNLPCEHLHNCQYIDGQCHMKIQTPETSGICKHVHSCFHSNHWIKHQTNEKKMRMSIFRGYARIIYFTNQDEKLTHRVGLA
jgi:hypothetical protein